MDALSTVVPEVEVMTSLDGERMAMYLAQCSGAEGARRGTVGQPSVPGRQAWPPHFRCLLRGVL